MERNRAPQTSIKRENNLFLESVLSPIKRRIPRHIRDENTGKCVVCNKDDNRAPPDREVVLNNVGLRNNLFSQKKSWPLLEKSKAINEKKLSMKKLAELNDQAVQVYLIDKEDFSKIKNALTNNQGGKSRPNKTPTNLRNLNKQREVESKCTSSYHELSHLRNKPLEKIKNQGRLIKDKEPEESRQNIAPTVKPKVHQPKAPLKSKAASSVQNRCSSPIFRNETYFHNNSNNIPPSFIKLPQSNDDSDALYVPAYAFDRKTNSLKPINQLMSTRSDNYYSNSLTERSNKELFHRQQPEFPPISNRESQLSRSIDSSRIIISDTGVPTIEFAGEDYSTAQNSAPYRYNLKGGVKAANTTGSFRLKAEQKHPWDVDPQFPPCPYPIRSRQILESQHQQNARYSKAESYTEAGYKIDDLIHAREALRMDEEYFDDSFEALPRICDIPKYSDEYAEATKPKKSMTSNATQSQVTFLDESVATADVLMVDDESRSPFTNPEEQYKEPNLHDMTESESQMKRQSKSCSLM